MDIDNIKSTNNNKSISPLLCLEELKEICFQQHIEKVFNTKFPRRLILPMNRPVLTIPSLLLVLFQVQAQSNITQQVGTSSPDGGSNFQPSLAVVIGILCVMFSATFILLIYAKFCHRGDFAPGDPTNNRPGLVRSASRFSGIDKTVIESLPFFRFSSLRGSREGLECAVCLSKFEDVEILRLLPKCKHAFHISCVDEWLQNHSSCPLCRCKVNPEDPTIFTYSNSMRFQFNESERLDESNIELFVQREENHQGSSRFSVGSSFRKILKSSNKEEEYLIKESQEELEEGKEENDPEKVLHKFNHRIIVSDFVFKNRWSSVSSSDLMSLNAEMLNDTSSNRFSSLDHNNKELSATRGVENQEIMKIKEELEMKRLFESKLSGISKNSSSIPGQQFSASEETNMVASHPSIVTSSADRRAVSEITSFSRFGNLGVGNPIRGSHDLGGNNVKEEKLRRIWLPIARRTVQWSANREKRPQQIERTGETLDV